MNKEIVRNLCRWMALRHSIDLDRIRIGSNQTYRSGSASVRNSDYTDEVEELAVSISTYNTVTGSVYWDEHKKVSILDTIVHEFAHLKHFQNNEYVGHGRIWQDTYHKMLLSDWKELVEMYNLLSTDNLDSSFETMVKHNEKKYFNRGHFEKVLNVDLNYLELLKGAVDKHENVVMTLAQIGRLGLEFELGNKEIIITRNGNYVASLVLEKSNSDEKYLIIKESK